MKLSCRDTAEGNTFQLIFCGKLQAGAVAVPLGNSVMDDRTDRVDDISTGKVIGFGDPWPSHRFFYGMTFFHFLFFHDVGTFQTKFYPCGRVDRIVDTSVTGDEAAQKGAVRRIYDSLTPKCGNVTMPEIDPILYRTE
jgi:hypothetical protein